MHDAEITRGDFYRGRDTRGRCSRFDMEVRLRRPIKRPNGHASNVYLERTNTPWTWIKFTVPDRTTAISSPLRVVFFHSAVNSEILKKKSFEFVEQYESKFL